MHFLKYKAKYKALLARYVYVCVGVVTKDNSEGELFGVGVNKTRMLVARDFMVKPS